MLAKTTIIGLSLCATLGLVALANVAAPAADASSMPLPEEPAAYSAANGTPACLVIVQHAHVEGPICSSHFSYEKKTVDGAHERCGCPDGTPENGPAYCDCREDVPKDGPSPCGCPDGAPRNGGPDHADGDVTVYHHESQDNDVVDAKQIVTIGDVKVYDVVDVDGNDVDILEDIIENSDVDIVEENVVVVGGLL